MGLARGRCGQRGPPDSRQEPIPASSSLALCPPATRSNPPRPKAPDSTASRAPLRQGRREGELRTPDSTSSSEPAEGGLARAIEPSIHSDLSQGSSGCPQCPAPRCGVLQGSPSQATPSHSPQARLGATRRQPISAPPWRRRATWAAIALSGDATAFSWRSAACRAGTPCWFRWRTRRRGL